MIYNFKIKNIPELSVVGGKAKALIETTKEGFPVPDGIVLSVEFFKTWLKEIKSSIQWREMLKNINKENSDLVVKMALSLSFDENQKKSFESEVFRLSGNLFAVRSSSPEEDLQNTSFAGMYETVLGVKREKLEEAVSKAFDYRVMSYKKQNQLSLEGTSIAVIVQKQMKF